MAVELKKKGFQSLQSIERAVDHVDETEEEEPGIESFTYKKMEELKQESDANKNKFQDLILTGSRSLWLKDLNDLDCQLDAENYPLAEKKAPAKRARDAARPQWANKKRCIVASDSDEEDDEERGF
ncbi:hypothetical protein CTI12_AA285720 [Artemisia annua]|uniref:Uncharacterized protein n=1 Tax=Artemisia annua TaxID=35608 RepID=A0A2U1NAX1_ARTAN|nr:hypothetical protein CTI12_AA285720 [Artemisia annua]